MPKLKPFRSVIQAAAALITDRESVSFHPFPPTGKYQIPILANKQNANEIISYIDDCNLSWPNRNDYT